MVIGFKHNYEVEGYTAYVHLMKVFHAPSKLICTFFVFAYAKKGRLVVEYYITDGEVAGLYSAGTLSKTNVLPI